MNSSTTPSAPARADVAFSVPFVHRLRFTSDVLGEEQSVLADLLESSGDKRPRVQFWVDSHVAEAQPGLLGTLDQFGRNHADRCLHVGNHIVPGGESLKNEIRSLEGILQAINDADLDRRSYMVVLGGGAVLDAVGFAAAIAHRGIRLVRLPTTTLAQADSGVGVKNAVNLFGKKNWLGAFAVPWAVINDEALLQTLPDRDFRCGFSEAVKVTLLKNRAAFDQICRLAPAIAARDMAAASPVIRDSVELHLAHITQGGDPFEALEARPLDYGHWSAHKLEPLSNFALRHGEAVAIGVAIDTVYSSLAIGLPSADAHRVLHCLADLGFSLDDPALEDADSLFLGLEEFRQHLGGRLTLTMLRAIGDPVDVHEVDGPRMREAIRRVRQFAHSRPNEQAAHLASLAGTPPAQSRCHGDSRPWFLGERS